MFPLVRANRDEIRAWLGIIIFLQPDGTPVVEIGDFIVDRVHVNFLFPVGAYGNTPRWQYARTTTPQGPHAQTVGHDHIPLTGRNVSTIIFEFLLTSILAIIYRGVETMNMILYNH